MGVKQSAVISNFRFAGCLHCNIILLFVRVTARRLLLRHIATIKTCLVQYDIVKILRYKTNNITICRSAGQTAVKIQRESDGHAQLYEYKTKKKQTDARPHI